MAHLQYDLGNDDKALEYVLQAKERMYNAAPSNETAFTLYTELLVKTRKLFSVHKLPFPVELYKSIESEYYNYFLIMQSTWKNTNNLSFVISLQ